MREATIILPADKPALLDSVRTVLCDVFGGFTEQPVQGAWRADNGDVEHDTNVLFTVAGEPAQHTIRDLARVWAQTAGWKASYCRDFDGEVYIDATGV